MEERLDRQLRIDGWDQNKLSKAKITIIADHSYSSMLALSCVALGFRNITLISPSIDYRWIEIGKKIDPNTNIDCIESRLINTEQLNWGLNKGKSNVIVDMTSYNLSKKIAMSYSFFNNVPVVLSRSNNEEINIFSYKKGREYKDLESLINNGSMYELPKEDPIENERNLVSTLIETGIILEELMKISMYEKLSDKIIHYNLGKSKRGYKNKKVVVMGAGALGNFVVMALASEGFRYVDIVDPEIIELSNLNRQIMFYNAVGRPKAITLAERANQLFKVHYKGIVDKIVDISHYDIIFSCVDNFKARILFSKLAKDKSKILVDGGTSYNAGQVYKYLPKKIKETPAEFFNYKPEKEEVSRASCVYRPDPSVIMSNQIIGAIMLDILYHKDKNKVFYRDMNDIELKIL